MGEAAELLVYRQLQGLTRVFIMIISLTKHALDVIKTTKTPEHHADEL